MQSVVLVSERFQRSVHPPFLQEGGEGGVEPPTEFKKKRGGGLDRTSTFRGASGQEGDDFFQGRGYNFHIKNK